MFNLKIFPRIWLQNEGHFIGQWLHYMNNKLQHVPNAYNSAREVGIDKFSFLNNSNFNTCLCPLDSVQWY